MAAIARGFDVAVAVKHLIRTDPLYKWWIHTLGPLEAPISWQKSFDTADSLARSILHQQLSTKAAATIESRVISLLGTRHINGASLASVADEQLRACGVSGNKVLALRDLGLRDRAGEIPSYRRLVHMHQDDIIAALTPVRGIGRWTVEMMLMFKLGRPDILPVDDLGVRKGAAVLDRRESVPTAKELTLRGELWGPYRTAAAMLLWRIADANATAHK